MQTPQPSVVVAGDTVVDCHLYDSAAGEGRTGSNWSLHVHEELGGAVLTWRLIDAAFDVRHRHALEAWEAAAKDAETKQKSIPSKPVRGRATLAFDIDNVKSRVQQEDHLFRGFAVWRPAVHRPDKTLVWRVSEALGYVAGRSPKEDRPFSVADRVSTPSVLLLDDAGARFREGKDAWCLPDTLNGPVQEMPTWVVLKLSDPICAGALWHRLQSDGELRKRLVVVVSAKALRRAEVRLSHGLSWERSVEHLMRELFANGGNPAIAPLKGCRHLIVNFEQDGAAWVDVEKRAATLVFDPANAEGEWASGLKGDVFAYQTCLAAAISHELAFTASDAEANIPEAIERGLSAMRRLREGGHGPVVGPEGEIVPGAGFPVEDLAAEILRPATWFARSPIPSELLTADAASVHDWSILRSTQNPYSPAQPLHGLARQIVIRGEVPIRRLPHLHVGRLLTADRSEMEAMRGLRRLFVAYANQNNPGKKPLSVGVFGPPGAGKSMGVRELATGIFAPGASHYDGWMEFNLSQFADTKDLVGAFHQVRDKVLRGLVPVVFWDEFDSREYQWLQYLLAPMQDGQFQEGPLTHAIGKCVFVFAGGISSTFDDFTEPASDANAARNFRLAKAPDFKSRLDGYLNVLGPNQREIGARSVDQQAAGADRPVDPTDVLFPVRRALLIRSMLGCRPDERLDIDDGVVTALLGVKKYKHGARSLEKVLDAFRQSGGGQRRPIRRSGLPAPLQLEQHVDGEAFHQLCRSHQAVLETEFLDTLASALHEGWREQIHQTGEQSDNDKPFAELSADMRESNLAAALRIVDILSLAGLEVARGRATAEDHALVRAQIEHHLEMLAEAEHEGWMADKLRNGWKYAEVRDNKRKLHNCLQPFQKLSKTDQDKDRAQVRSYPDHIDRVNFQIRFAGRP